MEIPPKAKKFFVPTGFSLLYHPAYHPYFEKMKNWMKFYDRTVFLSYDYRDINFAKEKGYKIKLVPQIAVQENKINIAVLPQFVNKNSELYNVANENNAAIVNGAFSGKQTFIGKGAGGKPAGKPENSE